MTSTKTRKKSTTKTSMSTNEPHGKTVWNIRRRLGKSEIQFRCCDTDFEIQATGLRACAGVERARRKSLSLESQMDAFDDRSDVARLNREGEVENPHIAELVRRGKEYRKRTNGAFDIRHGNVEHDLKSYIRGERQTPPNEEEFDGGNVTVDGNHVTTDARVDLNGLAKGYIVDAASSAVSGFGRGGFVNGGGDMSSPPGPVAVESPYGDKKPLKILDTNWNVATSGGYRRQRGDENHIYDPRSGSIGTRHESVTVVAEKDCVEADALATTVSTLPVDEVLKLVSDWSGAETLVVHEGVFYQTDEFKKHVHNPHG